VGRQHIALSPLAADAVAVVGQQVRFSRHDLNWTIAELANRAGVSPHTVTSIESGSPAVSIGNVLVVVVAVGLPLFGTQSAELLHATRRFGIEKLGLIPSREYRRAAGESIDLDF
jgi:transcriptional regulator with XRE-family HTH domain